MNRNSTCPKCGGTMESIGEKLVCPYCGAFVLIEKKTEIIQSSQISAQEQADAFVAALKRQKKEEEDQEKSRKLAELMRQKKMQEERDKAEEQQRVEAEAKQKESDDYMAILVFAVVIVFTLIFVFANV